MVAKKATTKVEPLTTEDGPKPTAASKVKDAEAASPEYRVDLGEGLPTPPIKTATDHGK